MVNCCMSLDYSYLGHPLLRKKARPIEHIDDSIRLLIKQMKELYQVVDIMLILPLTLMRLIMSRLTQQVMPLTSVIY